MPLNLAGRSGWPVAKADRAAALQAAMLALLFTAQRQASAHMACKGRRACQANASRARLASAYTLDTSPGLGAATSKAMD